MGEVVTESAFCGFFLAVEKKMKIFVRTKVWTHKTPKTLRCPNVFWKNVTSEHDNLFKFAGTPLCFCTHTMKCLSQKNNRQIFICTCAVGNFWNIELAYCGPRFVTFSKGKNTTIRLLSSLIFTRN